MPPRSKNGSKISSLVSLKTRDGGGRVEPARRQTSSQNNISSASTISGGTTRAAVSLAILKYFSARGARFGVIVTTGATVVAGTGIAAALASALIAGIVIESASPCSISGPLANARPDCESDLNTLDGQGLQIRCRIFGIEHLAVEEGLLATRGRGWNVGRGNAEVLGRLLPEVLTVDLGDQRLGVVAGLV